MPEPTIADELPLEPCKCGEHVNLYPETDSLVSGKGKVYVSCESCNRNGPRAETKLEAFRTWNEWRMMGDPPEDPKVIPRCPCGQKVDVLECIRDGKPVGFYVYCCGCRTIHERAEERAEAVWSWCRRRYAEMSTWEHMRFLFDKANFLLEALRFEHGRRAGWYAWIVGIVLPILFAAGIKRIIRIL